MYETIKIILSYCFYIKIRFTLAIDISLHLSTKINRMMIKVYYGNIIQLYGSKSRTVV